MDQPAADGDRPRRACRSRPLCNSRSLHAALVRNAAPPDGKLARSVSSSIARSTSRKLLRSASLARATSRSLVRSASKSLLAAPKTHPAECPWGVEPSDDVVARIVSGIESTSPSPTGKILAKWKSMGGAASASFAQLTPKRAATGLGADRGKGGAWRGAATFAGRPGAKAESSSSGEDEIQFVVEEVPSLRDDEFVAFSTAPRRPRERLRDIVRRVIAKKPPALREPDRPDDVT